MIGARLATEKRGTPTRLPTSLNWCDCMVTVMEKCSTGLNTYAFSEKAKWRRRTWRKIAKNLKAVNKDPRKAKVLYLPGPEDLDRKVAIANGFRAENMICVDKCPNVIKKLRAENKVAIQGDILELGLVFREMDVLHADLCCGLTSRVLGQVELICNHARHNTVISVNMLNGREHDGMPKIKEMQAASFTALCEKTGIKSDLDKHRGAALACHIWGNTAVLTSHKLYGVKPVISSPYGGDVVFFDLKTSFFLRDFDRIFQECILEGGAQIDKYKSIAGNQYFHSVIFNIVYAHDDETFKKLQQKWRACGDIDHTYMANRRKIVAALAVSKSRKIGKLPPARRY
jgi:hypothetical protein